MYYEVASIHRLEEHLDTYRLEVDIWRGGPGVGLPERESVVVRRKALLTKRVRDTEGRYKLTDGRWITHDPDGNTFDKLTPEEQRDRSLIPWETVQVLRDLRAEFVAVIEQTIRDAKVSGRRFTSDPRVKRQAPVAMASLSGEV